jgi:sporulation protein YlmC with PRC-barrel domain
MGIYLGNVGNIELTRKSLEGSKESVVNPSDVNASRDRFSFDFDPSYLISGDLIEIATTDNTNLDFVDATGWSNGVVQSSGNWYAFIDELGGIRLYSNFDDSLEGGSTGLVALDPITRNIPIRVTVRDRDARLLGCISDYEINTTREVVDITVLSDEYRQQYSSLITGSGRLTAEWDYVKEGNTEPVNYLMQLVLRTEVGSSFHAKFFIKSAGTRAAGGTFDSTQINDALWWEFDALITSSATSFGSGNIIASTVDFVATGPIRLRAKTRTTEYLLQESGDKIKLEQDGTSFLLLEQSD